MNPLRDHLKMLRDKAARGGPVPDETVFIFDLETSKLAHGITDNTWNFSDRYKAVEILEHAAFLKTGKKYTKISEAYIAPTHVELPADILSRTKEDVFAYVSRFTDLTEAELSRQGGLGDDILTAIRTMESTKSEAVKVMSNVYDPGRGGADYIYRLITKRGGKYSISRTGFTAFSQQLFGDILYGKVGSTIKRKGARTLISEAQYAENIATHVGDMLEHVREMRAMGHVGYSITFSGANPMFDVLNVYSLLSGAKAQSGLRHAQIAEEMKRAFNDGRFVAEDITALHAKYAYYLSQKYKNFNVEISQKAINLWFGQPLIEQMKARKEYAKYFHNGQLVKDVAVTEGFRDLVRDYTQIPDPFSYATKRSMEKVVAPVMRDIGVSGFETQFAHHAVTDTPQEILAREMYKKLGSTMELDITKTPADVLEAEETFLKALFKHTKHPGAVKSYIKKVPAATLTNVAEMRAARATLKDVHLRYGWIALGAFAAYAAYDWLNSRKKEDYNKIKGLPEGWWADQMLEQTDFQSPYQGPVKTLPAAQRFMNRTYAPYFRPEEDRVTATWSSTPPAPAGGFSWFGAAKSLAFWGGGITLGTVMLKRNPYFAYRMFKALENFGVPMGITGEKIVMPGALFRSFGISDRFFARAAASELTGFERKFFKFGGVDVSKVSGMLPTAFEKLTEDLSFKGVYRQQMENLTQSKRIVSDLFMVDVPKTNMEIWNKERQVTNFFNDRITAAATAPEMVRRNATRAERAASDFEEAFNMVVGKKSTVKKGKFERWVFGDSEECLRVFDDLKDLSMDEKRAWLAEVLSNDVKFNKYFKKAGGATQEVLFNITPAGRYAENKLIVGGHIREKFASRWKRSKLMPWGAKRVRTVLGIGGEHIPVFSPRLHLLNIEAAGAKVAMPFTFGLWKNIPIMSRRGRVAQAIQGARVYYLTGGRVFSEGLNKFLGINVGLGISPRGYKGILGLSFKLSLMALGAYSAWHYAQYLDYKTKNDQGLGLLGKVWWAGVNVQMGMAKIADVIPGLRSMRNIVEEATQDHPFAFLALPLTAALTARVGLGVYNKLAPAARKLPTFGMDKLSNLTERKMYLNLFGAQKDYPLGEPAFLERLKMHLSKTWDAADVDAYITQMRETVTGTLSEVDKDLVHRVAGIDQRALSFAKKKLRTEMHLPLPGRLKYTQAKALEFEKDLASSVAFMKVLKSIRHKFRPKSWMGLAFAAGAVFASPLLMKIFPKETYEELQDIYSGRQLVPVRKGRWWSLSKTPFEGERISYYRPSLFHVYRTQAWTKGVYGSEEEYWSHDLWVHPIRAIREPRSLDVAYKHFEDRPYPMEPPVGSDLPGPLGVVVPELTKLLRKPRLMHVDEFMRPGPNGPEYYFPTSVSNLEPYPELGGLPPSRPVSPALGASALEMGYRQQQLRGFGGFIESSVIGSVLGSGDLDKNIQYLEDAGAITSLSRQWYGYSLGDPDQGVTEGLRRFLTKERLPSLNYYNPLPNKMPTWLTSADEYLNIGQGDPYTKIQYGELRLPGAGYEALYPELQGVPAEEYPIEHRYRILSDIFPYSEQTERLERRVEELGKYDINYKMLLEEVRAQNKARQPRIHLYPKRFTSGDVTELEATVKEITPTGIITSEMPTREVRLSGIQTSEDNITSINEYIKSSVKPGEKLKLLVREDPDVRLRQDENTVYMNAVVYNDGRNLNREIIDNNLATFEEKEPFDVPYIKHTALGRAFGAWAETAGRAPVNYFPAPLGWAGQKLSAQRTPIEDYAWGEAYGSRESYWTRPRENIAEPIYTYNKYKYGGATDIPAHIQHRRDVIEYFDKLAYIKSMRLAEQAKIVGDVVSARHFRREARSTMFGANPYGAVSRWKYIADRREQPYLDYFVEATAEDRDKILEMVPDYMRPFYMAQWANKQERLLQAEIDEGRGSTEMKERLKALRIAKYSQGETITPDLWQQYKEESELTKETYVDWVHRNELINYFQEHELPDEKSLIWDPRVDLEDVKLRLIKNEGGDFHDYNLWEDREMALRRKPYIDDISLNDVHMRSRRSAQETVDRLSGVLELEGKIKYNINVANRISSSDNANVTVRARMDTARVYNDVLQRATR